MTHPKYSAKYLLRKGKSYCKLIAQELGITAPEGDKRETITWVNAIVEHQANFQPIEEIKPEAIIEYDNSMDGTVEGEYMVIADGVVVRRFRTYLKAENWASAHYTLVSPQEVAQAELESQVEAQVEDNKEDAPERPRLEILDIDFGYYEFVPEINGLLQIDQVVATITRISDIDSWLVNGNGFRLFAYYQDAEDFIKQEYMQSGIQLHRGSGRFDFDDVIEDMNLVIETPIISDESGKYFAVAKVSDFGNIIVGYVCLNQEKGWTADRTNYSENWYDPARQIACANNTEYLLAA